MPSEASEPQRHALTTAAMPEPFDPAAVLADRDPGRTPVGFIIGMAIAAACAFVAVGIDAVQSFAFGDGPAPFAIALPLALLPVPLLISLVLWMDRLEPEPRQNLAFAFVWGAGIAALAALIINTADLEYVTMPALGASTGEYVAATFGAPVVEETMKGLVLFGLLWRRRDEIDGPTDGVIYAAMVGLGFAMVENVGYYINAIVTPGTRRHRPARLHLRAQGRGLAAAAPDLHLDDRPRRRLRGVPAARRRQRQVGGLPRLAGRGRAARHLERAVAVRHGGPDRRVPDHVGRAGRPHRRCSTATAAAWSG